MDEVGRKRKYPVDKNILIFTNSEASRKCAALFEFKITITREGLDGKPLFDPHFSNKDRIIDMIGVFFNQRRTPEINSVAACVWGSDLFLIPHDEDIAYLSDYPQFQFYLKEYDLKQLHAKRQTIPPCIFDLKNKKIKQDMPQFPKARKTDPILIAFGDTTIFALSTLSPFLNVPEPCFESLDPKTFTWTPLDCPPFHKNNNKEIFDDCFLVNGYVVLEKEGIILISVLERVLTSYYSYNIRSKTWSSPIQFPFATDFILKHYIHDEAVVVHNNIYTYYPWFKQLLVFSYTFDATSCCLSLGSMGKVGGQLEFDESFDYFKDYDSSFTRTGTIAKVDDEILCVLHTLLPKDYKLQHICVTFIQPLEGGKCITLKSFSCTLSCGADLCSQSIKSCFIMNDLEGESDKRHGKRAVLGEEDLMKMDCGGGTGERDTPEVEAM